MRGGEREQELASGGRGLRSARLNERLECGFGMTRESPREPANRDEAALREDVPIAVAVLPQARESELDERHRLGDPCKLAPELGTHGVVLQREPVGSEAFVDDVGPRGSGERSYQLHCTRERDAETWLAKQGVEEIAARGDDRA